MVNTIGCASVWIAGIATLSARPNIVGWDESAAFASHSGGMQFDQTPGNLEVSDFEIHLRLPHSISPAENLTFEAAFDVRSTILRFNRVPTSIPIDRDLLESFSVYPSVIAASALLVFDRADSPWLFGAWARSGLATDFRDLGSDDLTFSFACGAGYRFHDRLTIGLGAAVTQLTGDAQFHPGLGLDWQLGDRFQVGLCGPGLAAIYQPDPDWQFSIRGASTSEIWNIADDARKSRYIDFTSYRIGVHASRRLTARISLSAGAGVTFANEIGLNRANGAVLLTQGLDRGFYGQIGLTITSW